ncbi:MAG TPA: pilus assembly protein PilP [Nitrospirales bacterium]|jgi:Tfp pilus assembly protein PilP|nr:pilus assembly protein PilP [Nitrospirales bacterium]
MKTVVLHVVGLTAVVLLGVGNALAEPMTKQTLVAMSLLTGEDQKPPVTPPPKPKAPLPGSTGQAPAQPAAPAAPAKPGMPAPAAGTPTPTPAAPAAPQAGATPPTAAPSPATLPVAPAAAVGPKEPPKPTGANPPAMTTATAPGASTPTVDSAEGYSYDPKSRRDPFQSLTKLIKSASLQSQMPPLQRVQISDMKLLGIMWGGYGYFGLIQTPDGKGYTVKEGMLLGTNNGVIKTITDKAIIVLEPTIDIAGRKSTKEVEILLRPREVTE